MVGNVISVYIKKLKFTEIKMVSVNINILKLQNLKIMQREPKEYTYFIELHSKDQMS